MKKTKMEVKKSIDSEVYTYCSMEDALSECHRITNKKTGVSIKADGELKLAYMRMRKRFDFFNENGRDFYDSIETLWKCCTGSKSTFEDRLKKLKQVGLVTSVGKKGSVQKHTVAAMNPDDFLLERNDPVLGWVNCLEYPVFGSTRPQEPQQPETNPALPSSDDIHTSADSGSDDRQCEQQTESPPDTSTEEITKPVTVYPWGSSGAFNPNRSVTEPAKQWALSKTGGNVYQAERYLADYLSKLLEKPIMLSFKEEEEPDGIPF